MTQAIAVATAVGNGPAFRANRIGTQSISHNTFTKVQFETESYDTNNCYDPTNYRFTPNVAGYYKITLSVALSSATINSFCAVQKNGAYVGFSPVGTGWAGIANTESFISFDIYMNGTTDYVEGFVYQASGGTIALSTDTSTTYFSGFMFRSA